MFHFFTDFASIVLALAIYDAILLVLCKHFHVYFD